MTIRINKDEELILIPVFDENTSVFTAIARGRCDHTDPLTGEEMLVPTSDGEYMCCMCHQPFIRTDEEGLMQMMIAESVKTAGRIHENYIRDMERENELLAEIKSSIAQKEGRQ